MHTVRILYTVLLHKCYIFNVRRTYLSHMNMKIVCLIDRINSGDVENASAAGSVATGKILN